MFGVMLIKFMSTCNCNAVLHCNKKWASLLSLRSTMHHHTIQRQSWQALRGVNMIAYVPLEHCKQSLLLRPTHSVVTLLAPTEKLERHEVNVLNGILPKLDLPPPCNCIHPMIHFTRLIVTTHFNILYIVV